MSEEIAINLRGVSKKYRLFLSPKERLKEALHPFRKQYHQEFWALKEVSFDVLKGQALGILGCNGSGKSTLLQVIASVLQPTSGSVTVNGRVSALLELGAGFNPELTGRENVILNGVIQGISCNEMISRISEIEAFADIGEFFDQPVKTYSSGMFVRAAFAAAINVDPDILIIDEALAVGDARFQHKCFEKLAGFRAANKTIIIVTHSIHQVSNNCDRAILLDNGQVVLDGEPREVSDRYIELLFDEPVSSIEEPASSAAVESGNGFDSITVDKINRIALRHSYCKSETRYGDGSAEVLDCILACGDILDPPLYMNDKPITIFIKAAFYRAFEEVSVGFAIKTMEGVQIYSTNTNLLRIKGLKARAGEIKLYKFNMILALSPGEYFLDAGVGENDGSVAGVPGDTRRSVAIVTLESNIARPTYLGLFDLSPEFEEVSSADCALR